MKGELFYMNNVLAVTADLKRCSIAVFYENELFEANENIDSPTYLVQLANDLCATNSIDINKLNRLLTVSGPGSFTGIRTAQSFVKGLSLALDIPADCVSYFDVIKNLYNHENNLVAVINSDKKQVYYRDFLSDTQGVIPSEELDNIITPIKIPLVGDKIISVKYENTVIPDFKSAKFLLDAAEDQLTEVQPLYMIGSYARI